MRRFLIHGYLGGRNFGDELMLLGFLDRHVRPDDMVAIVTPDGVLPAHLAGRIGAAFPKTVGGFFRGLRWASDFVLCGGTVFHDAYPDDRHASYRKNLIQMAALLRVARLMGKRVHLSAIGLGPLRRPLTRRTARIALRAATAIGVRDRRSYDDAMALRPGVSVERVRDLAHDAPLIRDHGERTGLTLSLVPATLISTVNHVEVEAFYSGLVTLLAARQRERPFPIRLLAICVGRADSDVDFADSMRRRLLAAGATDVEIVLFDGDPDAMQRRIGGSKAVVAMRYHAATIAEKLGVPTFWLAYQRKVLDGADDLGVAGDRTGVPDQATLVRLRDWLDRQS